MQHSIILGFGYAGQKLHLPCLRKVQSTNVDKELIGSVVIVDPHYSCIRNDIDPRLLVFPSLEDVKDFDPDKTVVHVCTAPSDHLPAIQQASEYGYTKIIVEKPLTSSMGDLEELLLLQDAYHLDILVVANWLFSSLTEQIKRTVSSKGFGNLNMMMQQNKPRFSRTIANSSHVTAFDVEIPHQVALAVYLLGQAQKVIGASFADMIIGETIIPFMGKAQLSLLHTQGRVSTLYSDLTAPVRKRMIRLFSDDLDILGFYPLSAEDNFSQLNIYSRDGSLLSSSIVPDDPLTNCLESFYQYYDSRKPKPASDLDFNAEIIKLIHRAKLLCGLIGPNQKVQFPL